MRRRGYWAMLAAGLALDAAVFLLPLTPYPIIQKTFDRDYYEVRHGYEHFLETGTWKAGDRGFDLMREHYMTDVVRGLRPELDSTVMDGLRLDLLQIGKSDEPVSIPEKQPVYVIYSNQQGHIVEGNAIKILTGTFRSPYAMLVSLALLLVAAVLIYCGLSGILASRINTWNYEGSKVAENSLSRNIAS